MNIQQLYEENKKWVNLKSCPEHPDLFVLKYKASVFYNDDWNDFLRICRGLVIDKEFNIVSLPFTKIHNYGVESDAPEFDPDETVFASRKVNGFMIACTWHNNDLLWSNTGSLNSDFIGYAKEMFEKYVNKKKFETLLRVTTNSTYMFEVCHPNDPHIVHEEPGLYFIGCRDKEIGSKINLMSREEECLMWDGFGVKTVETWEIPFYQLLDNAKTAKHEGFVFRSMDGERVSKLKSPHYLSKKALMRSNFEKFTDQHARVRLDEEFYPLWNYIHEVERESFFQLDEVARREYIENWFRM